MDVSLFFYNSVKNNYNILYNLVRATIAQNVPLVNFAALLNWIF